MKLMKRFGQLLLLTLVLTAAILWSSAPQTEAATIDSGTCGDNLTWTLDDTGTLTISGTGAMDNYAYSSGAPWERYGTRIQIVIVENGVITIGDHAFLHCTNLTSIIIPDSVTTIGESALSFCTKLSSVTIPDSVTSLCNYAFYSCDSLTSVTISNSISLIGESAFSFCDSLTSVTIPDSVTTIGDSAFSCCFDLASVTIGNNTTTISDYAFAYCDSLTDVYYRETEDQWAEIAIGVDNDHITSATVHFVEPVVLHSIAIKKLPNKIKYLMGGSLDTIGLKLTATYSDGTTAEITEGYTVTGFDSATVGTKTVTVTYENFTTTFDVTVLLGGTCGANLTWTLDDAGTLTISGTGDMDDYTAGKTPWYSFRSRINTVCIDNGVTTIGNCAFSGHTALTEVLIPSSVISIGADAFYNCKGLTTLSVPCSIVSLGTGAFASCSGLTYVTIENGVTAIGYSTFQYCTSLSNVAIPVSVTTIYAGAFSNCTSLIDVYYGGSKTQWNEITIGDYNESLTNATIHVVEVMPQLSGIFVSTMPNKTVYISGEALDTTGLTLTLMYDDGSYQTTAEGFTVTGFNTGIVGVQNLTVTYEGFTTTFAVAVQKSKELEISGQPADAEVTAGFTAQFTVEATNVPSYKWQYRRNENAPWVSTTMSGYKTDTLSVKALLGRNGYQYRCKLTGTDGTVLYTEPVSLTVKNSITITAHPTRQTSDVDANATFTIAAEGAGLTYQWQYRKTEDGNWMNTTLTGCKTNALTVKAMLSRNGYQYRCAIIDENNIKVYTRAATLSTIGFTVQPEDQTVAVGETAVFTAAAKGQELTYRWQYRKSGDGGWMNTTLSGYDTDTLSVKAIAGRNGYQYRCAVTDVRGVTWYSEPATLTVETP